MFRIAHFVNVVAIGINLTKRWCVMKFEQKSKEYHPITITLETREEAMAFFDAIDKVTDRDVKRRRGEIGQLSIPVPPSFTEEEIKALHAISNAITVQLVEI